MNKNKPYRLLVRNREPFQMTRSSLWQGDDHIMQASHQLVEDRYRRLFFKDIHAIQIQKTGRYRLSFLLFGIATASALLLLLVSSSAFARGMALIVGAPALILLLTNAVAGPSCSCWIRTALGETRLTAVTRVRKAERMARQIEPQILAAQANHAGPPPIPPSAPTAEPVSDAPRMSASSPLETPLPDAASPTAAAPSPLAAPTPPTVPQPLPVPPPVPGSGRPSPGSSLLGQATLCLLLLVLGLCKARLMLQSSLALSLTCCAVATAFAVGLVALLARHHERNAPPATARFNRNLALTGAGLGLLFLLQFYWLLFSRMGEPFANINLFIEFSHLSEHRSATLRGLGWLVSATSSASGLIGLGMLARRRRREQRPCP